MSSYTEGPGRGRLVLRLAVGAVALGIDRAAEVLRRVDVPDVAVEAPLPAAAPRHLLIGALCEAPRAFAAAWTKGAARAEVWGDSRAGRVLSRLGRAVPAKLVAEPWRQSRARVRATMEDLVELGRREERAGRILAHAALEEAAGAAVARVAASPELHEVIAEQSAGLGTSALAKLRARSARADGNAEALARRITGRGRSSHD